MDLLLARGVLVPHLYGASSKPPVAKVGRKKWTKQEFFEALADNVGSQVVDLLTDLLDWAEEVADRIWLGTGRERGSITFHYLEAGKTISVFTIDTSGTLVLNYGWLSTRVDKDTMEEFHNLVHRIPSFEHIPAEFSKWPSVKVADAFLDQESIQRFKDAVVWLRDRIHLKV